MLRRFANKLLFWIIEPIIAGQIWAAVYAREKDQQTREDLICLRQASVNEARKLAEEYKSRRGALPPAPEPAHRWGVMR